RPLHNTPDPAHTAYSIKDAQIEEHPSVSAGLEKHRNNFEDSGIRHIVEGFRVVHRGHLHICMPQIAPSSRIPSPLSDELGDLRRCLDDLSALPISSCQLKASHWIDNSWELGDSLARWWRPNFETFIRASSLSLTFNVVTTVV
ncbi:hypothetical protein BJV74DRAFT_923739, partial [Russula compacta]